MDVEQKALLDQVMRLTPEQINALPPEQRAQVLQLQQALRSWDAFAGSDVTNGVLATLTQSLVCICSHVVWKYAGLPMLLIEKRINLKVRFYLPRFAACTSCFREQLPQVAQFSFSVLSRKCLKVDTIFLHVPTRGVPKRRPRFTVVVHSMTLRDT